MRTCIQKIGETLAFVQAETCQFYAVDAETWIKLHEVIAPTLSIDYTKLGAIWAFMFSMVVGIYLLTMQCQSVVNAIKRQ